MDTTVQRWGNSLAVRIPRSFAAELGLGQGAAVELRLVDGGLLVKPAAPSPPTLDELLEGVTEDNLPGEVHFGPAWDTDVW